MAGGHAGFEDEFPVRFRDAVAIVDDCNGPVAPVSQERGNEDSGGPRIAGVAQELEEGVLYVGDARRTSSGPLHTREAGEASAEVPVGAIH